MSAWSGYQNGNQTFPGILVFDMTTVIRRVVGDRFENHVELATDSWDLRTQIETLEEWLFSSKQDLDPQNQWVADVGFCVRPDATGGGPPLTRKLMKKCLELNLEIYLSEYRGEG